MGKKLLWYLLIVFCLPVFATEPGPGFARFETPKYSLLFDTQLNMRGGAESLVSLHHFITGIENRTLGNRWFDESVWWHKGGAVALRYLKYALLDVPLDYFTPVLMHEYYGHGARYREFELTGIKYGFDWPPPYGPGGGEATLSLSYAPFSQDEYSAIWSGGIESHNIIQRRLSMNWAGSGVIPVREASVYFWTWQIMFRYIQDTEPDLTADIEENDPRAWVRILNNYNTSNLHYSVDDLKKSAMISMADPMLVFSLYALLKTYLWDGADEVEMPMIPVGGARYLPLFRFALTPFGVEYHMENYLRKDRRVILLDLATGDDSVESGWGGVGISVTNVMEQAKWSLDANVNMWKQPGVLVNGNPGNLKGDGLGLAASVRGHYRISGPDAPVRAVLEAGYKTAGFLQGYQLDAGPVVLFGLAFSN